MRESTPLRAATNDVDAIESRRRQRQTVFAIIACTLLVTLASRSAATILPRRGSRPIALDAASASGNVSDAWSLPPRVNSSDNSSHLGPNGLETYCGRTIVKNTQSVANATRVFEFYQSALSAVCQRDEPCDLQCDACGHAMRAALRPSNETPAGCFGLHAVNSPLRASGGVDFGELAARFEATVRGATARTQYHGLMDQATMLYADDLAPFVEKWRALGADYLRVRWRTDTGRAMESLLVAVPTAIVNVELVATASADLDEGVWDDASVRLSEAGFVAAGVDLDAKRADTYLLPQPLAISKAVTNLSAARALYVGSLDATEIFAAEDASSRSAAYLLPGADLSVRFVERAAGGGLFNETVLSVEDLEQVKKHWKGARVNETVLSVAELEQIKRSARFNSFRSPWCGMSRYYDNHLAYSRDHADAVDFVKLMYTLYTQNQPFHCEQNALYVWEPAGDAMFISRNDSLSVDAATRFPEWPEYENVTDESFRKMIELCMDNAPDAADLCAQGQCSGTDLYSPRVCEIKGGLVDVPPLYVNDDKFDLFQDWPIDDDLQRFGDDLRRKWISGKAP